MLAKLLAIRLGQIKNTKLTIGSGTNEPNGIVTAAVAAGNIYTMPTGNTTAISYPTLVNIKHAVDPAYRDDSTWMWHDSTLKALKLLVDAQNRPLWQPGLTASFREGAGVTLDKPVVLNHPYVMNQDMPPMAANATSIMATCLNILFAKWRVESLCVVFLNGTLTTCKRVSSATCALTVNWSTLAHTLLLLAKIPRPKTTKL